MTDLPYPPLLLEDRNGVIWKEEHRRCQQLNMVPTINVNAAAGPQWWWYCETCSAFVRPLNKEEMAIVSKVLDAAMAERKAQFFKKKKRANR